MAPAKSKKPSAALEANFDGLVGPTHNYAGLAHGNVASQANRRKPANPRAAALQGLEKMRRLAALGLPQAVLPPHRRPDVDWLRRLGFAGKDGEVVAKAAKADPVLLAACYSASAMWTANAATVSPSADSADGRIHFTPANLSSQTHRSVEPPHTAALLRRIFPGPRFVHHPPLPPGRTFGDEGAANHIRLAPAHGSPGLQVFVYGYEGLSPAFPDAAAPRRFQPRQSLEASRAVARLHGLDPDRTLYLAQNPAAIDAGVFHNDVISVGNGDLLFCHEAAFRDQMDALAALRARYAALGSGPLRILEVKSREVSLRAAVSTYLFNSQILGLPDGTVLLLAAGECRGHPAVRKYLEALPAKGLGIDAVEYADLRQSMRNGGGPACLRLRVAMTAREWAAVPEGVKMDETLFARLKAWVERHYRDRLLPADLADPDLPAETRKALDGLDRILGLGS